MNGLVGPGYADVIRNMPGLVAYYPMDESQGTVTRAPVGINATYASTGVAYGGPGVLMDGAPTTRFTGSPGRSSGSNSGLPSGAAVRSGIAWFSTTTNANMNVFSYGGGGVLHQSWGQAVFNSTNMEFWSWADDKNASVGTVNDGRPHCYGVSYDGSTAIIAYYDGGQAFTFTLAAALNTVYGAEGISIGRDAFTGGTKYMVGSIGHVSMFNRTLTANEFRHLYVMGSR